MYPSGRQVNYSFDANRVTGVSGQFAATTANYAQSILFGPHGAISSLSMGGALTETTGFNSRLQLGKAQ